MKPAPFAAAIAGAIMLVSGPAFAQEETDRIRLLEERLQQQDARIAELERRLGEQAAQVPAAVAPAPVSPVATAAPSPKVAVSDPALDISGDLRLRQEFNWGTSGARDRTRNALRARLRASYALSESLTIGGQIATGDPDDPNSTDVTLSNFADDLTISLDQVYARYRTGGLTIYGGKFPQILRRTDVLWDGDVSPQGLGVAYAVPVGSGMTVDARALYFIIDESVGGKGSAMLGGQAGLSVVPAPWWRLELAASYYDYTLHSVAGADAGDIRSNLVGPDGRFLSDFDLVEGLASLTFEGLGESWPIGLTGNYVRNLGAVTGADTAYLVEFSGGRATESGDLRLAYAYASAETDAVFAAFSHDNLDIATDYLSHGLSIDYVVRPQVLLNASFYHYRQKDGQVLQIGPEPDWRNRLRLHLLLNF